MDQWYIDDQSNKPRGAIWIRDVNGSKVARISASSRGVPRDDALLIAAAPLLFAALAEFVRGADEPETYAQGQLALDIATGKKTNADIGNW